MARESTVEQQQTPKEDVVLESARIYNERAVPALFIPWGRRLLEDVPIGRGQDILDVACGSGAVTRLAAAKVGINGSLTGLDMNPGMLEIARESCRYVQPEIDWRQGDATDMPFDDEGFDTVVCQQGVQFIPDKSAALKEIHRVLRPGGWLGFTVWRGTDRLPGYHALCKALEEHVGTDAADVMRTPFSAGDMEDLRQVTKQAGFPYVQVSVEVGEVRFASAREFAQLNIDAVPPGPKGHLKAMYESVSEENREALMKEVERSLAAYTDDEGVVWPMEAVLVVARK